MFRGVSSSGRALDRLILVVITWLLHILVFGSPAIGFNVTPPQNANLPRLAKPGTTQTTNEDVVLKKSFVSQIAERADTPEATVEKVLKGFKDVLVDNLSQGKIVKLQTFGIFSMRHRKAREGYHVLTGERIFIPEHYTPGFSFSAIVKKLLAEDPIAPENDDDSPSRSPC